MTERLIAKLDRLGAEAGIKEMTPEIYRFSQLLNDDKLKQWDEWRSQRTWVGLTDERRSQLVTLHHGWNEYGQAIEAELKQNNGYAEEKNTPPQRTDKERILQLIKELRPAIKPLEGMGRGKTTEEWFDILVQAIEEKNT